MSIFHKHRTALRCLLSGAVALLAASPTHAVVVMQGAISQVENVHTAPINIENDDTGVTYNSLRFDAQLAGMLWQAYGVADLYGNDFAAFTASGTFGYAIDTGLSPVKGWSPSISPDGTISIQPGMFGGDAFSTGQTMAGNYFFNRSLLDTDGDGLANYTFHFADDLTPEQALHPLSILGQPGSQLNGNFIEAYTGLPTPYLSSGAAYALVPTADHPAIPEPSAYAALFGALALCLAARHRHRKHRTAAASSLSE